ncbi:MAG: uroporphyrinogen decarboxylase family protein [Thermoproteota archaeon]
MNPRERVLIALKHEEPDRVPIDLGSMPSTGIMAIAYSRLKKYLGINKGVIRVYDTGQQLAEPEKEILEYFNVDVITLTRTLEPCGPSKEKWKPWKLPDGTQCEVPEWFNPEPDGAGGWVIKNDQGIVVSKMPKDSLFFDSVYHPFEKVENLKEVENYEWDSFKINESYAKYLRKKAEYLYENTIYAIHFFGFGSLHEWGQGLRGWSNWLMDLTMKRRIANVLLEKMFEVLRHNLKIYVEELKDYVQIIGFGGEDLGVQSGPQIPPKVYREMLKPYHSELFHYIKKHSKLFVFLHSCGSIYSLIPDLIDAGVDIINPVQISAKNMEPSKLKAEFGKQLTFWGGGVDTQHTFYKKPEEVYEHVKNNILAFAPGGGYVFTQVHNIVANVPPENIVAAYRSAYENGRYPIVKT